MSNSIIFPIVGAHFRPPAKAILASLPSGQELWLRPEPTNPYDENAVQVLLRTESIPNECWENLILQASGMGFDEAALRAEPLWHLGYIPKAVPKGDSGSIEQNIANQQAIHRWYAAQSDLIDDDDIKLAGALSFDTAGKPTIIISPWPLPGVD